MRLNRQRALASKGSGDNGHDKNPTANGRDTKRGRTALRMTRGDPTAHGKDHKEDRQRAFPEL
jgi:hypothetical protein